MSKTYYRCTFRGVHRTRLKLHWAVEVYTAFWTEEKVKGVWDFQGKVGNSQIDNTEQTNSSWPIQELGDAEGSLTISLLDFSLPGHV